MLNTARRLVDQARHPSCNPTPMRPVQIVLRATLAALILCVLILLWPSWLWIPFSLLVGVATVIHPFCLIAGKKHAPGGHWAHFEK